MGNIYFLDGGTESVRKIDAAGAFVTTVAPYYNNAYGIDVGGDGTVYWGDTHGIQKVRPGGQPEEIVDTKIIVPEVRPDATSQGSYRDLELGPDGKFYFVTNEDHLLRCDAGANTCHLVAGVGAGEAHTADGADAVTAYLPEAAGLTFAPDGSLLVTSTSFLRRVRGGKMETAAGSLAAPLFGENQTIADLYIGRLSNIAEGPDGSFYLGDSQYGRIWRVRPDGTVVLVAGNGVPSFNVNPKEVCPDGTSARACSLRDVDSIVPTAAGEVYFNASAAIQKVDAAGNMMTVAGGGEGGGGDWFSLNGLPAKQVGLFGLTGFFFLDDGSIYLFGDNGAARIDLNGIIHLDFDIHALAQDGVRDAVGNYYYIAYYDYKIYKKPVNGPEITFAGTGQTEYNGEDIPALQANINPRRLFVGPDGLVYFSSDDRIRYVTADGKVRTLAGGGEIPFWEGLDALAAEFGQIWPFAVFADGKMRLQGEDGRLYVLESERFFSNYITNAASYVAGGIAPGEIVTIFGTEIGPAQFTNYELVDNKFAKVAGGTRILFDGVPSAIIYAFETQTSVVVPYSIAGKDTVIVETEVNGVITNRTPVRVLPMNIGIFTVSNTGVGQGAIQHWPDYALNGVDRSAKAGDILMVYTTMGGEQGEDGAIATAAVPHPESIRFMATLGGKWTKPFYIGTSPGLIWGLIQVNLEVPEGLAPGNHLLNISVIRPTQNSSSQAGVTVSIE